MDRKLTGVLSDPEVGAAGGEPQDNKLPLYFSKIHWLEIDWKYRNVKGDIDALDLITSP